MKVRDLADPAFAVADRPSARERADLARWDIEPLIAWDRTPQMMAQAYIVRARAYTGRAEAIASSPSFGGKLDPNVRYHTILAKRDLASARLILARI